VITPGIPEWPEGLDVPLLERRMNSDARSVQTLMDSGRVRNRRRFSEARETMGASWNFTEDQYEAFDEFFRDGLENGSLSFLMVTQTMAALAGYIVRTSWELAFVGNYTLDRSDNLFSVIAVLEVTNKVEETVIDPGDDGGGGDGTGDEGCIPFKMFNGMVYQIVTVPSGAYVSGRFTKYGNDSEGWTSCKGIARILKNGNLDSSFKPGGIEGGGFDISGGYFAPGQIQPASDGGCFVGVSFTRNPERRLYLNRSEGTGVLDAMSLNGTEVDPVVKLLANGSVDPSFSCSFLKGAATNSCFQSFHMYEILNRAYYTYQKGVESITPGGDAASYTGQDFCVLELRTLGGSFLRRVFRNGPLGLGSNDFSHQVFVDESMGYVVWTGQKGTLAAGGLAASIGNSESTVLPLNWRMAELRTGAVVGVLGFDLDLEFQEPLNWDGYSKVVVDAGTFKTFHIDSIFRGCFAFSLLGSFAVDPDGATANEGRWTGGPDFQFKGGMHFRLPTNFAPNFSIRHAGSTPVLLEDTSLPTQDGYYSMAFSEAPSYDFDVYKDPDGEDDGILVAGYDAGEWNEEFARDFTGGLVRLKMVGPESGDYDWIIYGPAYRQRFSNIFAHWDLRSSGDPENPLEHGFSVFPSAYTDSDGCSNVRGLVAMHDGIHEKAGTTTPSTLGVFFSGCIEKFKGVVKFAMVGQLAKIRHNGEWDDDFLAPVFGPSAVTLKENIDSGADEALANKISCAWISDNGKHLYVGGRFTDVGGTEVGHIVCLDINTGELMT
jgi:hypothetical protein